MQRFIFSFFITIITFPVNAEDFFSFDGIELKDFSFEVSKGYLYHDIELDNKDDLSAIKDLALENGSTGNSIKVTYLDGDDETGMSGWEFGYGNYPNSPFSFYSSSELIEGEISSKVYTFGLKIVNTTGIPNLNYGLNFGYYSLDIDFKQKNSSNSNFNFSIFDSHKRTIYGGISLNYSLTDNLYLTSSYNVMYAKELLKNPSSSGVALIIVPIIASFALAGGNSDDIIANVTFGLGYKY